LVQPWPVKAFLVFGAAASVEIAQHVGVPILGRTFDPLDFAMYGLGVAPAIILDSLVLPRVLPFWAPSSAQPASQRSY
jgi:hypothetical protein